MSEQSIVRKPTYHERNALAAIKPWLIAENVLKSDRSNAYLQKHNYVEARSLHAKLSRDWEKIQRLRTLVGETKEKDALLKYREDIGRTALLGCEDARQAFIHLSIIKPRTPPITLVEAETASWSLLDRFASRVSSGEMPLPRPERLDMTLEEAINGYNGRNDAFRDAKCTYIGMLGLTTVLLSQQTRGDSERSLLVIPPHKSSPTLAY